MPSENYLVTFTTAANLAGVDALKASMLGLNVQTIALAALLFAVFEVGKAGVDNFKKQEKASNDLSQAYVTQKDTLVAHKQEIERFLQTNARFINDQYDTQEALGNLIRAGFDTKESLEILGAALDRTAVKGGTVTDSQKLILLAMLGNKKGIKELGITNEEYDKIMKDKTLPTAEKQRRILKLIEDRYAAGRDTIDQTTQKQDELNKHWQDFTARTGPGVLGVWKQLIEAADTLVQLLDLTVQYLTIISSHDESGNPNSVGNSPFNPNPLRTKAPGIPSGAGAPQPIVIHNKLILGGRELDLLSNTIINNARHRPGT